MTAVLGVTALCVVCNTKFQSTSLFCFSFSNLLSSQGQNHLMSSSHTIIIRLNP